MIDSNSTTAMHVLSTLQSPSQGPDADVARALQDAATARQNALDQARAAQREAQQAQEQAREGARQAQQEMEQAKRQFERAIREATEAAADRGRGAGSEVAVPPPFPFPVGGPQIPEGAVVIAVAFFMMCAVIAVGLPIARAFSRRVDRKHAVAPAADSETRARLERIEQAVDAIAVEVERISEGQRYTTKVIGELRALPQPDPSVAIPDRVAVPISRAREAR